MYSRQITMTGDGKDKDRGLRYVDGWNLVQYNTLQTDEDMVVESLVGICFPCI